MIEWVSQAHDLLIASDLKKSDVESAVREGLETNRIRLRKGVVSFIDRLTNANIPMIIFSAGIADVLEQVLKMETNMHSLPENICVVSNRCMFGSDDKLKAFEDPVFHVFNKRGTSILETNAQFLERTDCAGRKSLILLGDSLGDLTMADGLKGLSDTVLCVGFLNDRVDERLEDYLSAYDVVIVGDPEFNVVNDFLFHQIVPDSLHHQ